MKTTLTTALRGVALLLALGGVAGTAASVDAAERPRTVKASTAPLYLSFDWHGPRKTRSKATLAAKRRNAIRLSNAGRGSYICSPSGSGRRATCRSR